MDYELSSGTIHCFYCHYGVIHHVWDYPWRKRSSEWKDSLLTSKGLCWDYKEKVIYLCQMELIVIYETVD